MPKIERGNTALNPRNPAKEKHLAQNKAFRVSKATWTKLKLISLKREVPMNRIVDEAVEDLFKRELPDEPSDSDIHQAPKTIGRTKFKMS